MPCVLVHYIVLFFDPRQIRNLSGNSASQSRRSLRGPARWVADGPRRRRGVHRDGLEEAVISSSGRLTLFGTRSPAIAFRPAPTEHQSVTSPSFTVNERARHPDRNSLTDLADLGCDFAFGHRELSRGSQRPFSSPSFWRYFHFPGTKFSHACGVHHIVCMQCFIWEVGSATASVQACVTRVLASKSLRRPRAPSSLASRRQVAALVEVHTARTA